MSHDPAVTLSGIDRTGKLTAESLYSEKVVGTRMAPLKKSWKVWP